MKHDYLKSSLWCQEKIEDPYQAFAALFVVAGIADFRKIIKKAIQSANTCSVMKKSSPGDLLYEFSLIESAINAAYIINKSGKKSPFCINREEKLHSGLYAGFQPGNAEWTCFPRCLSFKEFADPYLVFKRFFKYLPIARWKQYLNFLLHYALSETSLSEAGIHIDTLSVYIYLNKLLEAAHLVDVREINHIDGHMKNIEKAG